ncbi:hypothetical protein DM01DRAFT_113363 [Hesseltinella vesiculosa]|uniref:Uncharacterized protein n=1 Tax=Hesseltinella vesiculosa TaxID=101127 RepID=A0A1X2G7X1_9FUNG|nr:hypothetical protein DM01DRAFT_113363 [Hesseltinella vesiculosa]
MPTIIKSSNGNSKRDHLPNVTKSSPRPTLPHFSAARLNTQTRIEMTFLPPSLRITTNKQAFLQSSDNASPILEGVLIRRAWCPASHLNHYKEDSSASSASPQEDHPLTSLGSPAGQPAPMLVDRSQPWQPPTLTSQTPRSLQQQLPSGEPHPSPVAKLLSKGEDSLFHRLTHRHHHLPQHDDNHDQIIYPPPTPLMDQDTEL